MKNNEEEEEDSKFQTPRHLRFFFSRTSIIITTSKNNIISSQKSSILLTTSLATIVILWSILVFILSQQVDDSSLSNQSSAAVTKNKRASSRDHDESNDVIISTTAVTSTAMDRMNTIITSKKDTTTTTRLRHWRRRRMVLVAPTRTRVFLLWLVACCSSDWMVSVDSFVLLPLGASSFRHHDSAVILPTKTRPTRLQVTPSTTTTTTPKSTTTTTTTTTTPSTPADDEYDVVVVGSGIGGLSCAAMLTKYGYSVAVLESHYAPGGAAHGFSMTQKDGSDNTPKSFTFDTGPSFFAGLNPDIPSKSSNPLRTVLDAIDERVECVPYTTFGLVLPEGNFIHTSGFGKPGGVVEQVEGRTGIQTWSQLLQKMEPLAQAVEALPTLALRGDWATALTAAPYLPKFAKGNPLDNLKLTKSFQKILQEAGIGPTSFSQRWLDLLCFCLSGLPADGTITAEMAMMMGEFYDEGALMDCPIGGSKAIVDALVRGIENQGGRVFLKSPVDKIIVQNGKATGIRLAKTNQIIRAKKAVVSNLSVWDLYGSGILDPNDIPDSSSSSLIRKRMDTPLGKSFMHLHVGFRATRAELEKWQAHYMYLEDWDRGVEAEDNAVLLSIPSVHDDTLAPDGYGVLHIYTPATEDYSRWEGLDRKSKEYQVLKEERSQYLWKVLEKIIPDIRERTVLSQVGTPLTHQRFLNRYRGSYGPAIRAGQGNFPFPGETPLDQLLVCGDSVFPGIGVPAVAGSGILAANSVSLDSLGPQLKLLEQIRRAASSATA